MKYVENCMRDHTAKCHARSQQKHDKRFPICHQCPNLTECADNGQEYLIIIARRIQTGMKIWHFDKWPLNSVIYLRYWTGNRYTTGRHGVYLLGNINNNKISKRQKRWIRVFEKISWKLQQNKINTVNFCNNESVPAAAIFCNSESCYQ